MQSSLGFSFQNSYFIEKVLVRRVPKGGERIISVGLLCFIYLRYEHESSRLFSLLDDFKLRPELFVGLRKVDDV